jgi:aromatic ring-opening dioxygenase catalytic subunit (LigB family)
MTWTRREVLMTIAAAAAADGAIAASVRLPTAFIPHGGGPWPVLSMPYFTGAGESRSLSDYMKSIAKVCPVQPRALLVISAHWEEAVPTVSTSPAPPLLFDYSGFPKAAYQLEWAAPGDPDLAARVRTLLGAAGFETAENASRGYDHGTFIPLLLAWPDAGIPTVQLSLKASLDPEEHLAMGRALAPLRDQGVFVIGSGNSWHNLPELMNPTARIKSDADAFDRWLADVVTLPESQRDERLRRWQEAPSARLCHPREEHLVPLMVVAGAAGADAGVVAWSGSMRGKRISAHHFGV